MTYTTLIYCIISLCPLLFFTDRAAETGEGNFYFIGHEIKDMFYKLKDCISALSKSSSLKKRPGESVQVSKRIPQVFPANTPTIDSDILLIQPHHSTDEESSSSTGGTEDGSLEPPLSHPGTTLVYSNMPQLPLPSPSLHSPTHTTDGIASIVPPKETSYEVHQQHFKDYASLSESTKDNVMLYETIK